MIPRLSAFGRYGIPPLLYSVTFGGILPLVSLLFSRVFGDTADAEAAANPELTRPKQAIKALGAELSEAEMRITDAEARAIAAERRLELPTASVAIVASASPGDVFAVRKLSDGRR